MPNIQFAVDKRDILCYNIYRRSVSIMKYTPPIYNALEKYAQNTLRRFHMPGHGGNIADGFLRDVSKFDVTELCETDDLAAPAGVIKEAQILAARKFGSGAALFSCHGATLCIQAAVYAELKMKPQGRIFCHRRVHKAVLNAFVLLDVQPVWITDFDADFSECDILVFTWTDYYGNIAPYRRIEEISRKYGIVTVADNAHGSHLAFYDGGKLHPTRHGIDFCVESLHKTLPVLTGGACLNMKDAANAGICREGMTLFGSTSPNYLIMASIDRAIADICEEDIQKTLCAVRKLEKKLDRFFIHDSDSLHRDPLRMVLRCEKPKELYNILYQNGIKCEFYDACGVVAIPPFGADEKYFEPLERVLLGYDPGIYNAASRIKYTVPQRRFSVRQAQFMPGETVLIQDACGKVSAKEYSLYPPGIPLIVPGEIFTQGIIHCLKDSLDKVEILN